MNNTIQHLPNGDFEVDRTAKKQALIDMRQEDRKAGLYLKTEITTPKD